MIMTDNKNFDAELKDLLEKHIPQHAAKFIQDKLADYDNIQKQNEQLEKDNEKLHNAIDKKNKEISDLKKLIETKEILEARASQLDIREQDLHKLKDSLEIKELKYKLENEREKTDFAKSVALNLVRNIEYRKTVFDTQRESTQNAGTKYNSITGRHEPVEEKVITTDTTTTERTE